MIKCRTIENNSCVNCNAVRRLMVSIGAFVMCEKCWYREFGVVEIDVASDLYEKNYKHWLHIYQDKYKDE